MTEKNKRAIWPISYKEQVENDDRIKLRSAQGGSMRGRKAKVTVAKTSWETDNATMAKEVRMSDMSSWKCLNCQKELYAATGVGHGHSPEPGSISICIYCSHIMAFDDDLNLRQLTDDEIKEIAVMPKMLKAIKAIEDTRRLREDNKHKQRE